MCPRGLTTHVFACIVRGMRHGADRRQAENVLTADEPLLTVQQAAKRLQVSTRTVYDMMERGELAYVQVTTRFRRIPESAITAYLNRRLVVA